MRRAVCACLGVDFAWASEQFPRTPYRFNLMERLASQLHDVDAQLPCILKVGSPTGVRCAIPASGVWRPTDSAERDVCDIEPDDLEICESNHWSAVEAPERVQELLEEEISLGYVTKFTGNRGALQERFPAGSLAVGKLGLVRKPGKADRLIGDSSASKASPQAKFSEKAEVPAIGYFSQALDRFAEHAHRLGRSSAPTPCSDDWMLLSIDVKCAHKSIKTASEDVGFAVFQLWCCFYIYLVNHFGASWSWWARLGALLLRISHFVLRHKHLGAIYVDDFLWLLPKKAFAPMAALLIALLQILGVPISWKKLRLGSSLAYLGWLLDLRGGFIAHMSEDKSLRLLGFTTQHT